jgi:uncharacterized coiled-coil DUF342 family protein
MIDPTQVKKGGQFGDDVFATQVTVQEVRARKKGLVARRQQMNARKAELKEEVDAIQATVQDELNPQIDALNTLIDTMTA